MQYYWNFMKMDFKYSYFFSIKINDFKSLVKIFIVV